jgi:hypothetical protein
LDVLSNDDDDTFGTNLGHLSMNFRELELQNVFLPLEFALDNNSKSGSDTSRFWPYLENDKLGLVDVLLSGEPFILASFLPCVGAMVRSLG